jgi:lipopolysaccharide export system protein LptC
MTRVKDQLGYLYLALLAVASWLLVELAGVDDGQNRPIPPHSPDFFSQGYSKWQMGKAGQADSELLAGKIVHYSDDRTTHLEQPEMVFHQDQHTSPWAIHAESGEVSADSKNVLLQGRVNIERKASGNAKPLKIITSNLKVKPETHYAETDERAELISLQNKTTGTGMKLVFKQPVRIDLLADVQGKYETQR